MQWKKNSKFQVYQEVEYMGLLCLMKKSCPHQTKSEVIPMKLTD